MTRSAISILSVLTVWLCAATAHAGLIMTIDAPDRLVHRGDVVVFTATIENDTGANLFASDLALGFSGFNPVVISLHPLLGLIDFLIPAGTTSVSTALFDATAGDAALINTTYFVDVLLQDPTGGNFDTARVSLTVVPEPPALWLMVAAAVAMLGAVCRRSSDRTRR